MKFCFCWISLCYGSDAQLVFVKKKLCYYGVFTFWRVYIFGNEESKTVGYFVSWEVTAYCIISEILVKSGVFSFKSFYTDLMNRHTRFLHKYLWKIKVPLKIKIFMWFLYKKVLLTKDNLAKRKWTGCKKCAFCDSEESIEHLFIKCPFATLIWRVVHFTFNTPPPTNIRNMFGNWLNGVDKKIKAQIRIGLWCGQFGIAVMMLFLTKQVMLNFCRLFTRLRTRSTVGLFSCQRTKGAYGYWMYSIDGGRSGYLQSGWLVAY
jgi:hypothetical protein